MLLFVPIRSMYIKICKPSYPIAFWVVYVGTESVGQADPIARHGNELPVVAGDTERLEAGKPLLVAAKPDFMHAWGKDCQEKYQ